MKWLYIYLLIVNIFAFALSFWDKRAAIRGGRRIREKSLFLYAAIGGSIGLYLSMLLFRHKTRHLSFMIGVPAMFILQLILLWYLVF